MSGRHSPGGDIYDLGESMKAATSHLAAAVEELQHARLMFPRAVWIEPLLLRAINVELELASKGAAIRHARGGG